RRICSGRYSSLSSMFIVFPFLRGALGAVVALNIASEKISFSRVIATHPWLRALDQAGRA
ncbi:hypothetical protein R6G99_09420, partial [Actinotignum timonense]|nr:hypothetical protein [Actinotignum timonense]